jgi:hypothetical protein
MLAHHHEKTSPPTRGGKGKDAPMSTGYGPLCEPIEHEDREYRVAVRWGASDSEIEISEFFGREWLDELTLPGEVALKVAAAILDGLGKPS